MSKNYFSDIIKQFVKHRYPQKTEEKVQQWIVNDKNLTEKNEEIYDFWQSLDLEADESVYESLDAVNRKLDIKPYKKKPINIFLKIAAVLIPFICIIGFAVYMSEPDTITVHVPYGEKKQITLADGSTVWINSGSTIKYPDKFQKKNRTVYLTGEAYFSVVKDESKRFIVKTEKLSIEVLGTEFNVDAYPEDSLIIAYVAKGKVQVAMRDNKKESLTASQQIIYNKFTSEYKVGSVLDDKISVWKNGNLIFEKKTLSEILKVLERNYNVSFETDTILSADRKLYTVRFVNQENIEQIMSILGEMTGFAYKTDNGHIILHKIL